MNWTEKPQTACVCDSLRRNHLREFFHDTRSRHFARELRNRATSDVHLGRCLAQRLRSRRHVYVPWRVHATDLRDRHAPAYSIVRLICRPLSYKNALDIRRNASRKRKLRAVSVTVSVAFIALESRVRGNDCDC